MEYVDPAVFKVIFWSSGGLVNFPKRRFSKTTPPTTLILFQSSLFYMFPMAVLTNVSYRNCEISISVKKRLIFYLVQVF